MPLTGGFKIELSVGFLYNNPHRRVGSRRRSPRSDAAKGAMHPGCASVISASWLPGVSVAERLTHTAVVSSWINNNNIQYITDRLRFPSRHRTISGRCLFRALFVYLQTKGEAYITRVSDNGKPMRWETKKNAHKEPLRPARTRS